MQLNCITIADINLRLRSERPILLEPYDDHYRMFEDHPATGPAARDINVRLRAEAGPQTGGMEKIFGDDRTWSAFASRKKRLVVYQPGGRADPLWSMRLALDSTEVDLYCGNMPVNTKDNKPAGIPNPVRYPLDQILMMYLLSGEHGAVVHAGGIDWNGRGLLFAGPSGSGKSTLLRLLQPLKNARGLSDDRVAVRRIGKAFMAFGTPWPGDAGIAENSGAAVSAICFLRQGKANRIIDLDKRAAFERLLPVTSIPWYDRDLVPRMLSICEDMAANIPACVLEFRRDPEVAHVLETMVGRDRLSKNDEV